MKKLFLACCAVFSLVCVGCGPKPPEGVEEATPETPVFSLAISEYPSWSAFLVASKYGVIDGEEGLVGPVEQKWGVDIVIKKADYDTTILQYSQGQVDAVCITGIDAVAPAEGRKSVVVTPTSTSDGADACIVVGIDSFEELKGKPTKGLTNSVAQYCFDRNVEIAGGSKEDYPFENMDPAAAAQAVQTLQENINSIQVWNPFVLQTLRTRENSKVLFDSTNIPREIIDAVVVGADALEREGGDNFACAVIEAFAELNKLLDDPDVGDEVLVSIGEEFSDLGLEDMKIVVQQTKFYETPSDAEALFGDSEFQNEIVPRVVQYVKSNGWAGDGVVVGFNDPNADLNYSTKYLSLVNSQQ